MLKRVSVLVPLAFFSLAACGDDAAPPEGSAGKDGSSTAGAAAGSGGRPPAAGTSASGSGGSGGVGTPGDSEEGDPCMGASDCVTGLRCVAVPEILLNGVPLGVCGKPCSMDAECGDAASCYSYSGMDRDKHCVDVIDEDYALCGVADTSVCKPPGKICLVDSELPVIGLCATLCTVGASDDDAGVPPGEPSGTGCTAGQTCVGGELTGGAPDDGICGVRVARGGECGLDVGMGAFCAPEDICAPDNLDDAASAVHCYQRCTRAAPQCDSGACILASANLGYCI
jgi:hypothetical protein